MPDTNLQILIATYGEAGLRRTASMSLPKVAGVEYIVSCQIGDGAAPEIPDALCRSDIRVMMTPGRGLCANRNALLAVADAEYMLIADDDMCYTEERLVALCEDLSRDPVDIRTYRIEGAGSKVYPAERLCLDKAAPRGYYPSSVEIALRTDAVKRSGLCFCELFGIGAPRLGCGEEDILLWNARRLGLHIEYVPLTIGLHTGGPSTGQRPPTPEIWRARGAVLFLTRGCTWWMRIARQALRAHSMSALRLMLAGAGYARRHRKDIAL